MRHENSVFHQITKQVPWAVFDRLVETHKADFRVRRLSTKAQFVALIAYMLLKTAHNAQCAIKRPVTFTRLIRLNLMHRRPINALNQPHIPPPIDPKQMSLELEKC